METFQEAAKRMKELAKTFRKLGRDLDALGKPKSIQDFIEQKKQNEPFYKSNRKKPWE